MIVSGLGSWEMNEQVLPTSLSLGLYPIFVCEPNPKWLSYLSSPVSCFYIGLFGFLMSSFLSSLYILEMRPTRCGAGDTLFPFSRLLICFVDSVLCLTETFHFNEVPFIYLLILWSVLLEFYS